MTEPTRTKSKTFLILGLVALGGGALWAFFLLGRTDSGPADKAATAIANTSLGKAVGAELVAAEEREKYISEFVRLTALDVAHNVAADGDGGTKKVPGLFLVRGTVTNTGDRPVMPINLVLTTLGATNEVLGTYVEDVSFMRPLAAKESRDFKFEIPEKKGFEGRTVHKLR